MRAWPRPKRTKGNSTPTGWRPRCGTTSSVARRRNGPGIRAPGIRNQALEIKYRGGRYRKSLIPDTSVPTAETCFLTPDQRGEMDRIRIVGGQRLTGTIPISGAKNATLPLMIAGLLTEDTLILENVPRLADVIQLQRILGNHGVDILIAGKRPGVDPKNGRTIHISAKHIVDTTAPYELVSKMRASFWVVAPLVARMGEAKVSMPGGCAIGTRPVDLLIMALTRLGADIEIEAGYVMARAPKGRRGAEIVFPKVTVGGTHTAMMAASLARGTTVIENAAREPEIADVADCLNKMGAKIAGAGTSRIVVEGVARLNGARHSVLP